MWCSHIFTTESLSRSYSQFGFYDDNETVVEMQHQDVSKSQTTPDLGLFQFHFDYCQYFLFLDLKINKSVFCEFIQLEFVAVLHYKDVSVICPNPTRRTHKKVPSINRQPH